MGKNCIYLGGEFKENLMTSEIKQIFSAIKQIAADGNSISSNQDIQGLQGKLNKLIERLGLLL